MRPADVVVHTGLNPAIAIFVNGVGSDRRNLTRFPFDLSARIAAVAA